MTLIRAHSRFPGVDVFVYVDEGRKLEPQAVDDLGMGQSGDGQFRFEKPGSASRSTTAACSRSTHRSTPIPAQPEPEPVAAPQQAQDSASTCPVCQRKVHAFNLQHDTTGRVVGCYICGGDPGRAGG